MSPEEKEELASLYAIGLLEGEELAAFNEALENDHKLAAQVAEFVEAAALLARTVPRHPAPATMRQAIFREIEAEAVVSEPVRHGFSFSWAPWALAAALAVFCGVTLVQKSRLSVAKSRVESDNKSLQVRITNLNAERDRLQSRVTSLEEEKTNLEVRMASLEKREPLKEIRSVDLAPQADAPAKNNLTALWDQARQTGVLDLVKLPPPPADKDYQLWIIPADSPQPLDAGILTAAVGARAVFQSPMEVRQVAALAISLEPKGGSLAPQGPVIYLGKL